LRKMIRILLASAVSLLLATPAYAGDSTVLPEPGTLTLLTLGVAGVLIGRRVSRKPPKD
jgi:hypothetical protein